MPNNNPGTPDFQQGVANSQLELGTITLPAGATAFGIPPNCESLIVISDAASTAFNVRVKGTTTNAIYPTTAIQGSFNQCFAVTPMLPNSDPTVTVQILAPAAGTFHVVADNGVRTSFDPILDSVVVVAGLPVTGTGIQVLGTDGSHSQQLRTDTNGRLQLAGPNLVKSSGVAGAFLPVLALGNYCLYSASLVDNPLAQSFATLSDSSGNIIADMETGTNSSADHLNLNGFRTGLALTLTFVVGTPRMTVLYALEP